MSVAFTNLTRGGDTDGNASSTTASVTLTANRLHLLTINQYESNGATSVVPECTGWELVDTHQYAIPFGALYIRITVLRRMPSSNETGTHTITFGTANQAEVEWSIDQSDANVDTGGTNGSAAIVQAVHNEALAATSVSATLAAFGSTDNGTFGAFGNYGGGIFDWTPGSGFTALAEYANGFATDIGIFTQYRTDNDTSVDASVDASVDLGVIAIEIKAAGGGGGGAGPRAAYNYRRRRVAR